MEDVYAALSPYLIGAHASTRTLKAAWKRHRASTETILNERTWPDSLRIVAMIQALATLQIADDTADALCCWLTHKPLPQAAKIEEYLARVQDVRLTARSTETQINLVARKTGLSVPQVRQYIAAR
jgi:hypothetical protein